nr:PEP-CTERM sorting domain-containing protein [uncultured Desulfobulbus sp.]
MKTVKVWGFALLLVCSGVLTTQAAVIDFESLAHDDSTTVDHGATYVEDGIVIKNLATVESSGWEPSLASFGIQSWGYAGSTALFNDNLEGVTWIASAVSPLFSVYSIDLSELYDLGVSETVTFYATNSSGATVSQSFTLDGSFGMETFSFSSDFIDVASVYWIQTDYGVQFDNIVTSPVPEPSTLLLFGLGLFGLSACTNKKFAK